MSPPPKAGAADCGSPVEHFLLFDGKTHFHLDGHAAVLVHPEGFLDVVVLR